MNKLNYHSVYVYVCMCVLPVYTFKMHYFHEFNVCMRLSLKQCTHTQAQTHAHIQVEYALTFTFFFADWKGYTHVRLDGSTNRVWREVLITQFNLWVSTTDSLVLGLYVILLLFTLQFLLNLLILNIHFLCLSSLLSTTAMLCLFYSLLMIIFVSIRVTYSTIICQDIDLFF